jgi:hypothetical protein
MSGHIQWVLNTLLAMVVTLIEIVILFLMQLEILLKLSYLENVGMAVNTKRSMRKS